MASSSSNRPKSFDIPRAEDDLAEWASRIKAMQRQVDEDDQTEQRKLEEEIARSRMKRLRRSQMYASRPGTPDLATSGSAQSVAESDTSITHTDRKHAQDDALHKLTGAAPDSLGKTTASQPQPQPVSLAAFIGGKATGPRLNKPVAQPDAHDPTQFDHPSLSAPHPVFGRNGVAMPGMVGRQRSPVPPEAEEPPRLNIVSRENERRRSTPAIASRVPEPIQETDVELEPTHRLITRSRSKSRDRYTSTPAEAPSLRATPASAARPTSPGAPRGVVSPMHMADSPSSALFAPQAAPSRTTSPASAASTTPPSSTRAPSHRYSTPPASSRSPVSVPSLARPVQSSSPRSSGPYAPPPIVASVPSAAFLRAPAEKAPTPSLSRLKGRGFVQNMVRTSTELETAVGHTSPGAADKARPPAQKKTSVLDRWPAAQQTSPSPMEKPIPVRQVRHSMYGDMKRPVIPALQPMRTGVPSPTSFPSSKSMPAEEDASTWNRLARKKSLPQIAPLERTQTPPIAKAPTSGRFNPPSHPSSDPRTPLNKKKSFTSEHAASARPESQPIEEPRPILSKKKSFTSELPPFDSVNAKAAPGLGSSNTLISYIKPMKTGDNPITEAPLPPSTRAKTPIPEPGPPPRTKSLAAEPMQPIRMNVPLIQPFRAKTPVKEIASRASATYTDEFGVQSTRISTKALSDAPTSATPLTHPTRSRAKKPKKALEPAKKPESTASAISSSVTLDATPSKIGSSVLPLTVSQSISEEISSSGSPRQSRIAERRLEQGPANVLAPKPRKSHDNLGSGRPSVGPNGQARRPLPSLTAPVSPVPFPQKTPSPSRSPVDERSPKHERAPTYERTPPTHERAPTHERTPSTPRQRIPSTGSRATVMDVAQTFSQILSSDEENHNNVGKSVNTSPVLDFHPISGLPASSPPTSSPLKEKSSEATSPPPVDSISPISSPRPRPVVPAMARRASSYDRYSVALPPLKEETPTCSPAGSLSRNFKRPSLIEEEGSALSRPSKAGHIQEPSASDGGERYFDAVDLTSLSPFKVNDLLDLNIDPWAPSPDVTTISTEVMIVTGSNATAITTDVHILYDTEVVCVIQRNKSKSKGLVMTYVWGWIGKNTSLGDKESKKLHELAKRYGTSLTLVQQYFEPADFVYALGNRLAVRQGTRAHWSAENTTMHLVRSAYGAIFIDEHDLSVLNLCSAYSYCLSILDTIYVWHGKGSTQLERTAALAYAQNLAVSGNIAEFSEGIDDNDEMFWMILGSDEYAKADHWRWRANTVSSEPKLWRYDESHAPRSFTFMTAVPSVEAIRENVYLVDCHWEFYVLVGQNARGKRRDIATVIEAAKQLSAATTNSKPFRPPVHVLNLPSQLPLDLRVVFRGLDETILNDGDIPDHMNLLHQATAMQHLRKDSWLTVALRDYRMLPLGIHPSMLA